MAKFDRKTQTLKARVEFIRGTLHKRKGADLSAEEADTMTDDTVDDQILLGYLEAVDMEPAAEGQGGEPQGDQGGSPAPEGDKKKRS